MEREEEGCGSCLYGVIRYYSVIQSIIHSISIKYLCNGFSVWLHLCMLLYCRFIFFFS